MDNLVRQLEKLQAANHKGAKDAAMSLCHGPVETFAQNLTATALTSGAGSCAGAGLAFHALLDSGVGRSWAPQVFTGVATGLRGQRSTSKLTAWPGTLHHATWARGIPAMVAVLAAASRLSFVEPQVLQRGELIRKFTSSLATVR